MLRGLITTLTLLNLYGVNPYYDTVEKYCADFKLNFKIVYFLCVVENAKYNPKKVNKKNAVGIFQVRPIAYREYFRVVKKEYKYLNKKAYPDSWFIKRLKNPRTNIYIGCWYLRYLLNRNNNNYVIALSHYNTGSNAKIYNFEYVNKIFMLAIDK